jgi:hypothetical protein
MHDTGVVKQAVDDMSGLVTSLFLGGRRGRRGCVGVAAHGRQGEACEKAAMHGPRSSRQAADDVNLLVISCERGRR